MTIAQHNAIESILTGYGVPNRLLCREKLVPFGQPATGKLKVKLSSNFFFRFGKCKMGQRYNGFILPHPTPPKTPSRLRPLGLGKIFPLPLAVYIRKLLFNIAVRYLQPNIMCLSYITVCLPYIVMCLPYMIKHDK